MSANLDLVRSIYAAWERGDFRSIDWAHPDIEVMRPEGLQTSSWTGSVGMAEGFRDFLGAWEEFHMEAVEYRELDRDRVLVLHQLTGRGKTSGLELNHMRSEGANLFHVRDGKVTQLVFYWDRERALADLGLAPEGGSPDS
jgi:ketosteroid isomerase-like protein